MLSRWQRQIFLNQILKKVLSFKFALCKGFMANCNVDSENTILGGLSSDLPAYRDKTDSVGSGWAKSCLATSGRIIANATWQVLETSNIAPGLWTEQICKAGGFTAPSSTPSRLSFSLSDSWLLLDPLHSDSSSEYSPLKFHLGESLSSSE